jgi:hypothetical protein
MLANWLYGVAHSTAIHARRTARRRSAREKQVVAMREPRTVAKNLWNDLQPVLDDELSRLPDKYRVVSSSCATSRGRPGGKPPSNSAAPKGRWRGDWRGRGRYWRSDSSSKVFCFRVGRWQLFCHRMWGQRACRSR